MEGKEAKTNLRDIYGQGKGRTLTTDGITLINYSTIIAFKENGKLYLNKNKYSVTTSKIQGKLHAMAMDYYDSIVEYI